VLIRDRQMLAQDGMFVIIAIIDIKTGKVRKSPDIISRGFVYLKESQELLRHIRTMTKKVISVKPEDNVTNVLKILEKHESRRNSTFNETQPNTSKRNFRQSHFTN